MDDTAATTPSPSTATPAAGYDAARDKTKAGVPNVVASTSNNSGSSSSIRLLIKSSNQQYDDMNIESDLCWTVQRLKKQLSLVYPGKPATSDQKLIYSGKLLDDGQKLSEVIRSYKDVHQQHNIFHLVCATKNTPKTPPNKNATPNVTTNSARRETNTNDIVNELRQRRGAATAGGAQIPYQQQHQQQQQQQLPQSQMLNAALQYPQIAQRSQLAGMLSNQPHMMMHQQQAMLYNMWVQQWYAAYMQQVMQGTSGSQNATPPPMLHPLLQNMPVIPNNNLNTPLVVPQPVPVAAAAAGAVVAPANEPPVAQQQAVRQVNGPNFPNIQEEPEMRDWVDSLFSFTRLAIFVTVLYFNSSPLRCLLVLLIASVIYLYHIGVLRRRRERNNNNINRNNNAGNGVDAIAAVQQIQRMMDAAVEHDNNPQAAAEPAPAAAQDAPANGAAAPAPDPVATPESAGLGQADAAMAAAEAVALEPANANNSVISIVRTFVITFFTSLLPEAPAL